ncbi:arylesterase [Chelativorans sp. EGI FJ00035]|uniref:Arylesterase n=2 Tax=Chelativorans salis TaxID=2978478 RepID=A0ABT2LPF8_9HYPH|nr:arylesterase [Chelativorans sp. EGI FJ00035]MCT7376445.1 arylesterase [Chelativorans sp. EGI FJ00035]
MSSAIVLVLLLTFSARPAWAEVFNIVGFGDSLMAGYQLAPGEAFPEKLEAALRDSGSDVTVANAGVSGDTTSGGLSRLDWSVPEGTDLVILELGANDMLRGLSPTTTEKNLDEMLTRLRERDIDVLLVGMYAAPNLGPDYQEAFNAIYPRLAEKHGLPLVPFFLDGVAANASLLLEDGMHPNAKGVDLMVERMLPAVDALVEGEKPEM